jgi:hypothetical protein
MTKILERLCHSNSRITPLKKRQVIAAPEVSISTLDELNVEIWNGLLGDTLDVASQLKRGQILSAPRQRNGLDP